MDFPASHVGLPEAFLTEGRSSGGQNTRPRPRVENSMVDNWLVVWNMAFIVHNTWDNPSHWLTGIFFRKCSYNFLYVYCHYYPLWVQILPEKLLNPPKSFPKGYPWPLVHSHVPCLGQVVPSSIPIRMAPKIGPLVFQNPKMVILPAQNGDVTKNGSSEYPTNICETLCLSNKKGI